MTTLITSHIPDAATADPGYDCSQEDRSLQLSPSGSLTFWDEGRGGQGVDLVGPTGLRASVQQAPVTPRPAHALEWTDGAWDSYLRSGDAYVVYDQTDNEQAPNRPIHWGPGPLFTALQAGLQAVGALPVLPDDDWNSIFQPGRQVDPRSP